MADFRLLAEYSLDIVCRVGLDRVFRYVSPSSTDVLGWTQEEMVGRKADEFIAVDDLPMLKAAVGLARHTVVFRMRKKDGSLVWMENRAQMVRDPTTGEPSEWVVTMRDISERKVTEERLAALALVDGLTGLSNRRAFDEALEREWKRTVHDGLELCLLLMDIDHFKRLNDRYGHQAGDACLRAVSAAVRRLVRRSDTVARYGGEELAVILPGSSISDALEVAEKVRSAVQALEAPWADGSGIPGDVTVSVGAAVATAQDAASVRMPEGLLQAADSALYAAKHAGRNCVAAAGPIALDDAIPAS